MSCRVFIGIAALVSAEITVTGEERIDATIEADDYMEIPSSNGFELGIWVKLTDEIRV